MPDSGTTGAAVEPATRRRLALQMAVARLLSPLSLLAAQLTLRAWLSLRLAETECVRPTPATHAILIQLKAGEYLSRSM